MSLAGVLAGPFYEGAGSTEVVPSLWDLAINGRPYMIDWQYAAEGQFSEDSIKLLKPQQDDSGVISERSLNPEDYLRFGVESWHKGAGQVYADRDDSDPARFRSSKGVDPWEMWELTLLPATTQLVASANTNLAVETVGGYLYEADGQQVYHRSSIGGARTSSVIHVAEGAQTVQSIATDGYYLYAALGSNGIHRTVRGAATSTHYSDLSCTLVGYVKGRLMAANGNAIYNVIASGAAPAALFTHPNTDFTWVGFANGLSCLYAAGYSGDKSLVYRTAVKADGTALDIPVVAGELPDGEIIRSIYGYLGFVLLGTDRGVRFATADDAGNLTIGALIDVDSPVRCFEGQGRFVWFGWDNFDADSTGLGRVDLSVINGSAPAYASDLMATAQGDVLSACTFDDRRVFAVSGAGFYAQDTVLVAEGRVDGGLVTFGLPDEKIAMNLDLRHAALAGELEAFTSTDSGGFVSIGSSDLAGSTGKVLGMREATGETLEVRLVATRDSGDTTTGPTLTRTTIEATAAPGRGLYVTIPLLLHEVVRLANNTDGYVDPGEERTVLLDFEASGAPLTLQTGGDVETVFLDDHKFVIEGYTKKRDGFYGTFLARFKRPRMRSSD